MFLHTRERMDGEVPFHIMQPTCLQAESIAYTSYNLASSQRTFEAKEKACTLFNRLQGWNGITGTEEQKADHTV